MKHYQTLPFGSVLLAGDEWNTEAGQNIDDGWNAVPLRNVGATSSIFPGMVFRRLIKEEPETETADTGATRSSLYPKGAQFAARYDLMMRNAAGMRRLAETWGEGFAKYGADNCFNGFPESVLVSHALEHIRLFLAGDTQEDHPAHAAWNLLFLCWIQENKPELLDLTKPAQKL